MIDRHRRAHRQASTKVLVVVIDGVPATLVDPAVTPALCRFGGELGHRPGIGTGCLLAAPLPTLATLMTGRATFDHGVLASAAWDGTRFMPVCRPPLPAPTLFDACSVSGRYTVAVFGDAGLVGVTGALQATTSWPFGTCQPTNVATSADGRAGDHVVVEQFDAAIGAELPDFALVEFHGPDAAGTAHGPHSDAALVACRAMDTAFGALIDRYRPHWSSAVIIVVTSRGVEAVRCPEPVDLQAVFDRAGEPWVVHAEGNGALAAWAGPPCTGHRSPLHIPGVEGDVAVSADLRLLWALPGHWFGRAGDTPPGGAHGGPRSAHQVVLVGGGHTLADQLAAWVERRPLPPTCFAPTIASYLSVPWPPLAAA